MAIGDVGGRQNDTPLGQADYRLPVRGIPADGQTVVYSEDQGGFALTNSAAGNTFVVTDDAGTGDVASDVNNTNFTGQSPVVGQAAEIGINAIINFIHKGVSYQWVGPKPVTVGVGGNYTTQTADYAAQGTVDHLLLTNRGAADAHPISAITGLVAEQAQQDQNLVDHETAPDPHTQYILNEEGINTFVGAGYGGIAQSAPVGIPSFDSGWVQLPADVGSITTPRFITQDVVNDGIRFDRGDVWQLNVFVALEHNESNQGRTLQVRLWNSDALTQVATVIVGVGRNAGATNFSGAILANIPVATIGDLYVIELSGGTDSFTSVTLDSFRLEAIHVSEAATIEAA